MVPSDLFLNPCRKTKFLPGGFRSYPGHIESEGIQVGQKKVLLSLSLKRVRSSEEKSGNGVCLTLVP